MQAPTDFRPLHARDCPRTIHSPFGHCPSRLFPCVFTHNHEYLSPICPRACIAVSATLDGSASGSLDSLDPPAGDGQRTKLKLLCLHGYLQTGDVFRMRTGSMRKALKSRVEFVFIDAPYLVRYPFGSVKQCWLLMDVQKKLWQVLFWLRPSLLCLAGFRQYNTM